jgi:hypothetical protein
MTEIATIGRAAVIHTTAEGTPTAGRGSRPTGIPIRRGTAWRQGLQGPQRAERSPTAKAATARGGVRINFRINYGIQSYGIPRVLFKG